MKPSFSALLLVSFLFSPELVAQQVPFGYPQSVPFMATTELADDTAWVSLFNPGSDSLPVSLNTLSVFGSPAFFAPASELILPPGRVTRIPIRFRPSHNIYNVSSLLIGAGAGQASVGLGGQASYSRAYYSSTQNLSGEDLRQALRQRVSLPYTQLGYSGTNNARLRMFGTIDNWKVNGREPAHANPYKNECVYTGRTISYTATDFSTATLNNAPYSMNTEHTWPQSLGATNEPMVSDLHHIFISDGPTNSARGNKPFGWVPNPTLTYTGGSKANSTTFEPRDAHKTAAASAILYFAVRHMNQAGVDLSFLSAVQEIDLRDWLHIFPADSVLRRRNDDIQSAQLNRNPFIDYPAFLDRMTQVRGMAAVPPHNGLVVIDSVIQLGAVLPGDTIVYPVVLGNPGTDSIRITFIQPVGSGLSVLNPSVLPVSIAPGAVASITLRYQGGQSPLNGLVNLGVLGQPGGVFALGVQASVENFMGRFSLVAPANEASQTLEGSGSQNLTFRWSIPGPSAAGSLRFDWVLYGPAPNRDTLLWRNTLGDSQLTFTYAYLDSVMQAAGLSTAIAHGLVWTATAYVASSHRGAERAHVWNVVRGALSTSLQESVKGHFVLYPNPTRDRVVLGRLDAVNEPILSGSLRVQDVMGRQIPVELCGEEDGRLEWSVAQWPRGTYIVQFVAGAGHAPRSLQLIVD
ncbi:MAG: hypothetical protein FJ344_06505 [Sphingomonadales bacterium]|nr:hypothetical protein [Sphingomonadales bacterium]